MVTVEEKWAMHACQPAFSAVCRLCTGRGGVIASVPAWHGHKQPLRGAPARPKLRKVIDVCQGLPQIRLQHGAWQLQAGHEQAAERRRRQVQARQAAAHPARKVRARGEAWGSGCGSGDASE